jgi:hypothetical protein
MESMRVIQRLPGGGGVDDSAGAAKGSYNENGNDNDKNKVVLERTG